MNPPDRILIVEDSLTQGMQLRHALEQQGWRVSLAMSAERAMEEITRDPPDLVVVDYFLPEMRGDELCRRIRMSVDTRRIPILMLTAEETQQAELRGLESGADDFVSKSADADVLLLRVRTLLQKTGMRNAIVGAGQPSFRPARLLTIDDSSTYLEYLNAQLGGEAYDIVAAGSGEEGLNRLGRGEFDCVLVDLVMPGLDGIEVCRRIRELHPASESPPAVLVLTGRENKEELTRAFDAGADDFVGKSSDIVVLKGRIRALLRRKFYQDENQRISEELKNKELETLRARAEKEAAEARALLVEELQQTAAELQRSNRELEQFAYVASHDLKEPLRMIVNYTGVLTERLGDKLDAETDRFLHYIIDGARRMRQLIDDLLDFARVGRKGTEFEPIDLDEVVGAVLANLAAAVSDAGARVERDSLPQLPGNMVLLTQLFQNLIGNALKFRGDAQPVVQVRVDETADAWQVAVRDNGIGIEPQHFDRIFGIFQRLHTRDEYPGTGIGLAVCRKIVELHGGRIWVESEPGSGAAFCFTLAKQSPGAAVEPHLQEALGIVTDRPATKMIDILLVEDNAGDVDLTKIAVSEFVVPVRLRVVRDGEEALCVLRGEGRHADLPRPDLILLDLNLPRKTGHEVLAEIKCDANLRRIPTIVLTSSASEEDVLKCYNLHANCYLVKPLELDQFRQAMRAVERFWLLTAVLSPKRLEAS